MAHLEFMVWVVAFPLAMTLNECISYQIERTAGSEALGSLILFGVYVWVAVQLW